MYHYFHQQTTSLVTELALTEHNYVTIPKSKMTSFGPGDGSSAPAEVGTSSMILGKRAQNKWYAKHTEGGDRTRDLARVKRAS